MFTSLFNNEDGEEKRMQVWVDRHDYFFFHSDSPHRVFLDWHRSLLNDLTIGTMT